MVFGLLISKNYQSYYAFGEMEGLLVNERFNDCMRWRKEVKKECGTTDCDSIIVPKFPPKKPMVLNQNLFAKKKIEYFSAILMKYGHANSCPYPL